MYARILNPPKNRSFFLFGPRGTGKSSWVKQNHPADPLVNLLNSRLLRTLNAHPERLTEQFDLQDVKKNNRVVIIDEVQKAPALLDEVHRLIESEHIRFILTGSNARKLRRGSANLLAGRAVTRHMYPLTSIELGGDFNIQKALRCGLLPGAYQSDDYEDFLNAYVTTYLQEEIIAEGILRNLGAFSRFLEAASFSQAQSLNVAAVAQECSIARKTAEDYFQILEDMLLATRIPVFTKRAKRETATHPKFMFFDAGVYACLRPKGPLDTPQEIGGAALETLVWQELDALNDYFEAEYEIYFWRTKAKLEVDFVLYGPRGIFALEVKSSPRVRDGDVDALKEFLKDYPDARAVLIYGGSELYHEAGITFVPVGQWFGKDGFAMKHLFQLSGVMRS